MKVKKPLAGLGLAVAFGVVIGGVVVARKLIDLPGDIKRWFGGSSRQRNRIPDSMLGDDLSGEQAERHDGSMP